MPKDQEKDEDDGRTQDEVPPEPTRVRTFLLLWHLLVAVVGHGDPTDLLMRPA
jgi:hypothetical protein